MEDVNVIYHNNFGIAFKWKESIVKIKTDRIQLVFKDMGFYLTEKEVREFSENIRIAQPYKACSNCENPGNCRTILLKTPLKKMDFVVNKQELNEICDLVEGTLFHLQIESYLKDLGRN